MNSESVDVMPGAKSQHLCLAGVEAYRSACTHPDVDVMATTRKLVDGTVNSIY